MLLNLPDMLALADRCAPQVAPSTLVSLARTESGFDALAIGTNGRRRISIHPSNAEIAVATAHALIAAGRSIDLGLGQVNSKNLALAGLTLEAAFDPCRNLAASARFLQAAYDRSNPELNGEQRALWTALSYYNTGDPNRGFRNGYVAKVTRAAARIVPAIEISATVGAPAEAPAPPSKPKTPSWDVFGQLQATASFVIDVTSHERPSANGVSN